VNLTVSCHNRNYAHVFIRFNGVTVRLDIIVEEFDVRSNVC